MRQVAVFSLLVGIMMCLQWAFFLMTGNVPELRTAPWEIATHLLAELFTALLLIASGMGLRRDAQWAPSVGLLALGSVCYAMVNSSGYFAQRGQWALVGMFGLLVALALASILVVVRSIVAMRAG